MKGIPVYKIAHKACYHIALYCSGQSALSRIEVQGWMLFIALVATGNSFWGFGVLISILIYNVLCLHFIRHYRRSRPND